MSFIFAKTVIYLDKKSIRVGRVIANQVRDEQVVAKDWQIEDLADILKKVKKSFGSKVWVVLGDDLAYVLYEKIDLQKGQSLEDELQRLISERVPEDISQLEWHHRVLTEDDSSLVVQISAFVTPFYPQLVSALEKSKLKVKKIEPLSLALASQTKPSDGPMLLVYSGFTNLALVVNQSAVVGAELLNTNKPKEEIKSLMIFVRERYGIEVGDVKQKELHPMLGVVQMPERKKRKDRWQVKKNFFFKTDNPEGGKKKIVILGLVLLFLLMLLLALLSFRGWLPAGYNFLQPQVDSATKVVDDFSSESQNQEASLGEMGQETAADDEEEIEQNLLDLGDYAVQIQNGSGVAGAAGLIEAAFIEAGFLELELANAKNFDYLQTEVILGEEIDQDLFSEIKNILEEDYEVVLSQEVLTENSNYDVIVIVGTKK
jgi:hypothetical protein